MISPTEERTVSREHTSALPARNRPVAPSPRAVCVHDLIAAQAARTPDAPAVVADGACLTYGELDGQANRLARRLRGLGVGPETPVGVCLERSANLVVALLAVLKAGGAYVPLDPAYPAERRAFMLADAGAPVLLTARRLAADVPAGPWHVLALDDVTSAIDPAEPVAPVTAVRPDTLAYIIYTSGSTGQPKGVQVTHANLMHLVDWHRHAFAVTVDDRASQLASPAFDAAGWELWPYLTAGARVYIPDEDTRRTPALLRDWLVARQITISFVPTALTDEMMTLAWPAETALRLLLTGGDALHRYPGPDLPFAVVNNYGPTEYTVVATSGRVPPTAPAAQPARPPSIGRPIARTQVYILDEQMQPVPLGAPGELYIGGAGLARGYHNRPALTAERFVPDPFSAEPGARLYRTGDRCYYLPDGEIAFMGRVDHQVQIRGHRVETGEVEAALLRSPDVREAVVVAREDTPGDKRLVAYVVPARGAQLTAGALHDALAATLPAYMVPAAFVGLEALPLTPNDKVDRAALPAPDATNTLRDGAAVAPRSPIEERLSELVATLLGLQMVGVEDNFFLLGGHSLLGTQLIARIRDAFGVELTLRSLFEAPTIAQLSLEIEGRILAMINAMSDEEALCRAAQG